jgi:feruloyl esterase
MMPSAHAQTIPRHSLNEALNPSPKDDVMRWIFTALLLSGLATPSCFAAAGDCGALAKLTLPHTKITLARSVAAGAFTPEKPFSLAGPVAPPYNTLPAFCRVAAEVKAAPDSVIRFELWLPATGWNGKFIAVGNGGYSGEIWYPSMIEPVMRGYAAASTDTGHEGGVVDASFALGHPQKWIDFAYRAVHEMTVLSKSLSKAFYGDRPKLSYWDGCSTGGRQGLMAAQRYPADFDGIIAGAPANYMTHLSAQAVWAEQALHKSPASFLPTSKLPALHEAVLKACDGLDGVKDGVLEDPTRCSFDPKVLACASADGPNCLTPEQVETARAFYASVINALTHELLYPGWMPGSEAGWGVGVGAISPQPSPLLTGIFSFVVFKDPNWDYRTLNFGQDIERADHGEAAIVNAIDPNLKPFFVHGGKLIQYHGWADQGISPLNSINYYNSVAKASGGVGQLSSQYRLFMVPGMGHCRGGDGTDRFDMIGALEQWVEHQKAPNQIPASRMRNGKVDRTRPLCPYPQVAKYKGAGSTDDAVNFVCGTE